MTRKRKFCACGCGLSLDGMRSDAKWYSEACRKRAERAPTPDKARTARRSERGTRVYLLPDDLTAAMAALRRGKAPAPVLAKFRAAKERLPV